MYLESTDPKKSADIKISKLVKQKEEMEKNAVQMDEEERNMKSSMSKKRPQNDVLNVSLFNHLL